MSTINWRYLLIKFLSKKLFVREDHRLHEAEQSVIKENVKLGGSHDGFQYLGKIYSALDHKIRKGGVYKPLNMTLFSSMDFILEDRKTTDFEKKRIEQAFKLLLDNCTDKQQIRDAMPDSMLDTLAEYDSDFARMERSNPEAFTLADNPRAQRQYAKLREKMDFYVAARLIY